MKEISAVEWLIEHLNLDETSPNYNKLTIEKAKEMEKKQLFLSSNISPKDAYKAGQKTMECGCYEISDATTYEEWLYEQFKQQ
jgi:hypothetical protein